MVLIDTAEKIKNMEIRGAGRIACAAVKALREHSMTVAATDTGTYCREMKQAGEQITDTRPTAVSLPNAVHFVISTLDCGLALNEAREKFENKCTQFLHSSENAIKKIGEIGSSHIRNGDKLLTHCNSQAALACILEAHRRGRDFEVFATEVRPRNQGLLTIKILDQAGIPTNYIVDSAVRHFINDIDLVIVGADAVTVNGAVVNKIGTSQIALAAHEARTNFIVAAETFKFAPRTILGEFIEIEERSKEEVLPSEIADTLPHVTVRNPAFDVTPAEYVDMIVTEVGAIPPQMAYIIIRDYLGWSPEEFHMTFDFADHDQE
ncbi:MAG TPA: ribose 1,5-bisphosphate isomerase [Methanoregulaceae archaeon]|nr:ribose 1,5-bisphosphate isomerase [Methanoregulaceae archaeon]